MIKFLKLFGKIIGGLIGIIVIAAVVVMGIGYIRFHKTYDVDVSGIEIPTDKISLARGEHLVKAVAHCGYCHGTDFSGNVLINNPGKEGIVVAPNLTSGVGGIGSSYADEDWIRTIHHGVNQDQRSVFIMPSFAFDKMSQDDLKSIVAFMKSIPPVDKVLPKTKPGPLFYLLLGAGPLTEAQSALSIDHDAPFATAPVEGESVEYGAYLVEIGQCRLCHGMELAGGQVDKDAPIGPNLTPGGELGLWSEEDFVTTLRTGVTPHGYQLVDFMPWKFFRNMTDTELKAIWVYLQAQPKLETQMP